MAGPFGRAYLWGAALGDCLHLLLLAAWYLGVSCLLSENPGFLSIECGHGIAVDYICFKGSSILKQFYMELCLRKCMYMKLTAIPPNPLLTADGAPPPPHQTTPSAVEKAQFLIWN